MKARKTQIVTDEQQEPHASVFDHRTAVAGRVLARFAAGCEQMAFIIADKFARGFHEIHPVVETSVFGNGDAACDRLAVSGGPAAQGRDDRPAGPVGHSGGIEREARGEQFGQQHDIRFGGSDHRFEPREVPRGLFPGDVALAEGDAEFHENQSL